MRLNTIRHQYLEVFDCTVTFVFFLMNVKCYIFERFCSMIFINLKIINIFVTIYAFKSWKPTELAKGLICCRSGAKVTGLRVGS